MKKFIISFEEFDQTPGKGWRALEATGNFEEAGDAIIKYLTDNKKSKCELLAKQIALLYFHAGQMYAFCSNEKTFFCFNKVAEHGGLKEIMGPAADPYLQATIAFLKGDKATVGKKLEELLKIPFNRYPPGRFCFIPGKVHDMYENSNDSYCNVYNLPFKLPPLSGEKHWYEITSAELTEKSNPIREIAKRYNIDFGRKPTNG